MNIFNFIDKELSRGARLALAIVVSRSGSGPRKPGAMMVLSQDGLSAGTVGGGILEAQTLEDAKKVLIDGRPRLLSFDLTESELSASKMICGGRVRILVDCLDGANPAHVNIFSKLVQALDSGMSARLLVSICDNSKPDLPETCWGLVIGDDFECGSLDKCFTGSDAIGDALCARDTVFLEKGKAACFILPLHPPECLYIVGAGHIGEALAGICHLAEFRTVVLDDRQEFACPERFLQADSIRVISSYSDIFSGWPVRKPDRIVIATRSHLYDQQALAAALSTEAGYVGMVASRRKRDLIYDSLRQQGISRETLERVHSPIGLNIGAQTPWEIAVSIAAEFLSLSAKEV